MRQKLEQPSSGSLGSMAMPFRCIFTFPSMPSLHLQVPLHKQKPHARLLPLRCNPSVAQCLVMGLAAVPVTMNHMPLLSGTGIVLLTKLRVKPRARRLTFAGGCVEGYCFLCDFLGMFALTATTRVG